jgi:hypothetical protein
MEIKRPKQKRVCGESIVPSERRLRTQKRPAEYASGFGLEDRMNSDWSALLWLLRIHSGALALRTNGRARK